MTNIIIKNLSPQFVAVPNHVAQNLNLSLEALGALTRMCSYSNNFKFKAEWLQKSWAIGRDKLRRILQELKEKGYLKLEPNRNADGVFIGQTWHISTEPIFNDNVANDRVNHRDTRIESPGESPGYAKPVTRETSQAYRNTIESNNNLELVNNILDNTNQDKKKENKKVITKKLAESESQECSVKPNDSVKKKNKAEIEEVFSYWQKTLKHDRAVLDEKRERRIRQRLKHFSVEELKLAIDGVIYSDWHMGREPETKGKGYDAICTIFRDVEQVERFIALKQVNLPKTKPNGKVTGLPNGCEFCKNDKEGKSGRSCPFHSKNGRNSQNSYTKTV